MGAWGTNELRGPGRSPVRYSEKESDHTDGGAQAENIWW